MTGQSEYHLSNAIVNNDLVFSMGMNFDELLSDHSKFANEFVAYMIIENAYRSIDSGDPVTYTMDIHHCANYVANPKVGDSFSQSVNSKDNEVPVVPDIDFEPVRRGKAGWDD
jgi:hypothetical protein